jgi:hypothetical protein
VKVFNFGGILMKRLYFLGILISLGMVGISLMSGCSDDDNSTGPVLGDTSSAKFQYIDSTLGEEIFNDFGQSIDLSLELLGEHLGVSFSGSKNHPIMTLQGDDEHIVINSIDTWEFTDDFWWVFTFDAEIINGVDTTLLMGIDSVQLLLGNSPVESYAEMPNFNALKARAHVNGTGSDGGTLGAHHRIDVEVDEVGNDSVITVNGTTRDTLDFNVSSGQGECDVFLSQGLTINNLEILLDSDLDQDCMQNGSMIATASIDLTCTGSGDNPGPLEQLDIEGTWTITAVINDNGTVTITFTDGTTTWRITEEIECS